MNNHKVSTRAPKVFALQLFAPPTGFGSFLSRLYFLPDTKARREERVDLLVFFSSRSVNRRPLSARSVLLVLTHWWILFPALVEQVAAQGRGRFLLLSS